MLTEHFIASIGAPDKKPNTSIAKDAAIFGWESQPHTAQRFLFKKSATPPNCLAVSASHVYAAQLDKAVVHIYNREKGNQEATVPFPERIGCIALACEDTVLVLGSDTGRIFLWETHTGRQIATSQAHLQPVTALAVDPTSNFLLSGSADSSIHVWSIPSLLSFAPTSSSNQNLQHVPLHTLSAHRNGITSLVLGHSSSFCNIAISASKDNSCIIWDYHTGNLLRTILLPSTPLCLSLDPADRAFYTGYADGSVQILDFYSPHFSLASDGDKAKNPLFDSAQATMPVQPPPTTIWNPPTADFGATLAMSVSYDGCTLLTGHGSGKILSWDIPAARFVADLTTTPLPGPTTNIAFLPVTGYPNTTPPRFKQHAIVKPRYGAFDANTAEGMVPGTYAVQAHLTSTFAVPTFSAFEAPSTSNSEFASALTHPVFPSSLLAAGLAELSGSAAPARAYTVGADAEAGAQKQAASADFVAFDSAVPAQQLEAQNAQLRDEVATLKRVQRATFETMERLRREKKALEVKRGNAGGAGGAKFEEEKRRSEERWRGLGRTGKWEEGEDEDEE